jgi:hypothetical protein
MEEWRNISGYEGFYQISNFGRVKSIAKKRTGKTYPYKIPHIRIASVNRGGYLQIGLHKGDKKKTVLIHRLVLQEFSKISGDGLDCNHINGIKTDNRLENLEWATRKENILHSINVLGNSRRGEHSSSAKLTWLDVNNIRDLYRSTHITQKEISNMYNVSRSLICEILSKKRWQSGW